MTKILGYVEVKALTGLSKVTIWRMFNRGEFPKPIRLSPSRVGFPEDEIAAWLQARRDERDAAA